MKKLKNTKNVLIIFSILIFALGAEAKKKKLPYEAPDDEPVNLGYTHLLPSTAIVPAGTLVLGTTMGMGFFDIFDISTNLYLDLAQVFNVSTKVRLWRDDAFAVAVFGSYVSQSVQTVNSVTGVTATQTYSAFQPGGVVSYYILPQLTGHTGFTSTIRNPTLAKADFTPKNGFVQGNFINQEFTLGLSKTVALSSGGSYDFTYDIVGAGASVHVGGFQLGAHYYFNVTQGSFLPILNVGYSVNY